MQRSIIDKVFPRPKKSLLPQHDEAAPIFQDEDGTARSPTRLRLSSNVSRTSGGSYRSTGSEDHQAVSQQKSKHVHFAQSTRYDDPFLAIDRAASALQETIQSLLDFQGQFLSVRHDANQETGSQRSVSPSLSRTDYSITPTPRHSTGVVPIRQPKRKKPSLKAIRRGLGKSMQDFASLKTEELKIARQEAINRKQALQRVENIASKRQAVESEIEQLANHNSNDHGAALRKEAQTIEQETRILENRLLELKVRHRHLIDRAVELENAAASELSSYKATLRSVDKESLAFLRHPPIKQTLKGRDGEPRQGPDMFDLRPERRTFDLAREQWTNELQLLAKQEVDATREQEALLKGAEMWKEITQRVEDFETSLTASMKTGITLSLDQIITSMDQTMHLLHKNLVTAERNSWNLLVCAIGAEVISEEEKDTPAGSEDDHKFFQNDSDIPDADLLTDNYQDPVPSEVVYDDQRQDLQNDKHEQTIDTSNESLRTTLQNMPSPATSTSNMWRSMPATSQKPASYPRQARSDTDDDEPGPDFLFSH